MGFGKVRSGKGRAGNDRVGGDKFRNSLGDDGLYVASWLRGGYDEIFEDWGLTSARCRSTCLQPYWGLVLV